MSCSAGLAGFYVLVVEDEYYQAHDCCEWLRSAGATVAGPVRNGADAKHILARSKVDAVVVDINPGRGSDFELASHLTESGVPFIFATGYSQENIPAEFRHALTLQKPFNPQDLIVAVTSLRLTLAGSSVTTPGAPSLLPGRFESDLPGCSHRGDSSLGPDTFLLCGG